MRAGSSVVARRYPGPSGPVSHPGRPGADDWSGRAGRRDSRPAREKRRWPPGVTKVRTRPVSAQRRTVDGETPSSRHASVSVTQPASFLPASFCRVARARIARARIDARPRGHVGRETSQISQMSSKMSHRIRRCDLRREGRPAHRAAHPDRDPCRQPGHRGPESSAFRRRFTQIRADPARAATGHPGLGVIPYRGPWSL